MNYLSSFLKRHVDTPKSFLLGYSGGPDSNALLHMLLEAKRLFPISISLAHVDHGWRLESADEARQIGLMAERLGLELHLLRLNMKMFDRNKEEACRNERLRFFHELCESHHYDAVLLGHHANDQAETVLKRVFEGASIATLGALREESTVRGMKILRPLLKVTKKQILKWLNDRGLSWFEDKTNETEVFLRGRMRKKTFPLLEETFGKEVSRNLVLLAEESHEMKENLKQRTSPVFADVIKGPWGTFLDLNSVIGDLTLCHEKRLYPYELKFLVKQFAESQEMSLSRESLSQAVEFLLKGFANKQVISGKSGSKKILYIDRKRLFLIQKALPKLKGDPVAITLGETVNFGGWQVSMEPLGSFKKEICATTWHHLFVGRGEMILPAGKYRISVPNPSLRVGGGETKLDKLWTDVKVPSILRGIAPVVLDESGMVAHEFLTGSKKMVRGETLNPCLLRLAFK